MAEVKAHKTPLFITVLKLIGKILPGNYLKTVVYLNCIMKPRKFLRESINSFYRMDHIYDVLAEFKKNYKGKFSILEFGVSEGYAFARKLYATKHLKMEDRVTVHGFDSFEGMPAPDKEDESIVANDGWVEGQFRAAYQELDDKCRKHYNNYQLHKGYFDRTINEEFLKKLKDSLPILIWIDCDYYTSTKIVFERLIPYIPNGCVIYFDEPEFNFGSRFTGEAKAIYEINQGVFGDGIELVLDRDLSVNSKRIYRFINLNAELQYRRNLFPTRDSTQSHLGDNHSPLP